MKATHWRPGAHRTLGRDVMLIVRERAGFRVGLDPAEQKSLIGQLQALNGVLAGGAQAAGPASVRPDCTGHQLCDLAPYAPGLHDPAPGSPRHGLRWFRECLPLINLN